VSVAAADTVVLRPVRLVILTDWDAGFQLSPRAEQLEDVPPGGEYLAECIPSEPILLGEVLVRDFALVQVTVGSQVVRVAGVERGDLPRLYRLPASVTASPDQCVAALLRNDGRRRLKPKVAAIVNAGAAPASSEETAW